MVETFLIWPTEIELGSKFPKREMDIQRILQTSISIYIFAFVWRESKSPKLFNLVFHVFMEVLRHAGGILRNHSNDYKVSLII